MYHWSNTSFFPITDHFTKTASLPHLKSISIFNCIITPAREEVMWQLLFVCLLAEYLKKYETDFNDIFRKCWQLGQGIDRFNIGDILDSGVTLIFDLHRIKGQGTYQKEIFYVTMYFYCLWPMSVLSECFVVFWTEWLLIIKRYLLK